LARTEPSLRPKRADARCLIYGPDQFGPFQIEETLTIFSASSEVARFQNGDTGPKWSALCDFFYGDRSGSGVGDTARCGPPDEEDSGEDGAGAGKLRIRQSPEDFGVAANEFHQEARDTGEDEVLAYDGTCAVRFGPATPEKVADDKASEKFIERRGVDTREGGLNSVGEAHGPGKRGGDAVAAIAGEKTADSSDAIADGGGRCGQIESAQGADAGPPALKQEGGDAEKQAAVPGEAGRIPENVPAVLAELDWGVDDVPELGADDAEEGSDGDHPHSVGVDGGALEAAVHDDGGGYGGEPQHEPEGRHLQVP